MDGQHDTCGGSSSRPGALLKFFFSTQIAVRPTRYIYIVFVTGEDDITRSDSRRYRSTLFTLFQYSKFPHYQCFFLLVSFVISDITSTFVFMYVCTIFMYAFLSVCLYLSLSPLSLSLLSPFSSSLLLALSLLSLSSLWFISLWSFRSFGLTQFASLWYWEILNKAGSFHIHKTNIFIIKALILMILLLLPLHDWWPLLAHLVINLPAPVFLLFLRSVPPPPIMHPVTKLAVVTHACAIETHPFEKQHFTWSYGGSPCSCGCSPWSDVGSLRVLGAYLKQRRFNLEQARLTLKKKQLNWSLGGWPWRFSPFSSTGSLWSHWAHFQSWRLISTQEAHFRAERGLREAREAHPGKVAARLEQWKLTLKKYCSSSPGAVKAHPGEAHLLAVEVNSWVIWAHFES